MRHAGEAKQHDHRTLIQKVFGYCPSCGTKMYSEGTNDD